MVEEVHKLKHGPSVTTMRDYLEQMGTAPSTGHRSADDPLTLIAALGPKMLELARAHAQGAIAYITGPAHTIIARVF